MNGADPHFPTPTPKPAPLPLADRAALLAQLADMCAASSQRIAAAALGYSATTVNLVLKGKYVANPDNLLRTVRERINPDDNWLGALRTEAERTTQGAAARRIGVGDTTVSQVLSGNYAANTQRIERRVRGELMGAMCTCPVMGDVSTRVCQEVQERKPGKGGTGIGNPQHAQAWFACRGQGRFAKAGACPHFNTGGRPAAVAAAAQGA